MTWPNVKPGSHNDRILNLLADRQWHTSHEIQVGLQVMAHSRLAEMRDRGYRFEQRRVPGATGLRQFEYRLTVVPLVDGCSRPTPLGGPAAELAGELTQREQPSTSGTHPQPGAAQLSLLTEAA